MVNRELLMKKALPVAVLAAAGGAIALWGSPSGSPAEAPTLHSSAAMEAAPLAQGALPLQASLPPRGPNNTYIGKLDHTTTFYDKPNTQSMVVGLWPAHGVREANIACRAIGEMMHFQADEVAAGNNPDSDQWYAVDEVGLGGHDIQWIPAATVLVDQAVVPSCTPDIARR
jgi:hypothetical protein